MKDNKLIAKFMGIPSYKKGRYLMFEYADNNHRTEQDLAYHTSWDWLMPVVEKIDRCWPWQDSYYRRQEVRSSLPDMDRTYDAVVEFIKEYNDAPYTGFNGK